MATLEAAPEHLGGGRFSAEPTAALRAFGRIYAGWALSQDFYRADLHIHAIGAHDLEEFLVVQWERRYQRRRASDLYAQLRTWFASDISDNPLYCGDLVAALKAVKARVLLLPGATDLYFRVADNQQELAHLARGELQAIPSIWGHRAGNPSDNAEDLAFLRHHVRKLLDAT
jgi:homoserine O-acetyltransferase